jgi:hypothetical protein
MDGLVRYGQTDGLTDKQMNKQTDRWMDTQTDGRTPNRQLRTGISVRDTFLAE